jgi:hypothetical protein
MNTQDFEDWFKRSAVWSQAHGKVSLAIACFVIGFVLGKFL